MSKGVNPNAQPFVPSFAQRPPPPQQPQQQHVAYPAAAVPYYPAPPPLPPYTGMPGHHHSYYAPPPQGVAGLHPGTRPLYPGLGQGYNNFAPPPPPQHDAAPRNSYEQILRSRGTPDSKVLTPPTPTAVTVAPAQATTPSAVAPTTTPSSSTNSSTAATNRPLLMALLFLGPRGSGKSTQAQLAAQTFNLLFISAGELIRSGKQPFVELRRLVQDHFGPGVQRKYDGVALDRFIVNGEADVYYLQYALGNSFALPQVFLLMLDWEVALSRADARQEENRLKSTQRRMMEYRAHFDACENIYAKLGCLDRVDCENQSLDAVKGLIESRVRQHMASGSAFFPASQLPPACLDKQLSTLRMVVDYERFSIIRADVHNALHSTRYDSAPVSSMSGIVDASIVCDEDRRARRPLIGCFVTLKADGQRLIVVKHKKFGIFGFPQKFNATFDLTNLFAATEWPAQAADGGQSADEVEWVLDSEIIHLPGKPHPTILVFDYIFFQGVRGANERFSLRLNRLRDYFASLTVAPHAPHVMELKAYLPSNQLRTLLPQYDKAPFSVDGVVFQPDTFYRYGHDKTMLKWKPQSQCTVDLRLFGCREPEEKGGEWTFEGKAQSDDEKRALEEVTVEGIIIKIPHSIVINEQLADGSIIECARQDAPPPPPPPSASTAASAKGGRGKGEAAPKAATTTTPKVDVWRFYKNRPDKLVPNRLDIVQRVSTMKHATYEQLLAACDKL